MGYESRLYVAEKSDYEYADYAFADMIARYDLCCAPDVADAFLKYPATRCHLYDDMGEEITEDMYGNAIREIPIDDAITIIKAAAKKEKYRRFKPILTLLKALDPDEWGEIVVLHFGY